MMYVERLALTCRVWILEWLEHERKQERRRFDRLRTMEPGQVEDVAPNALKAAARIEVYDAIEAYVRKQPDQETTRQDVAAWVSLRQDDAIAMLGGRSTSDVTNLMDDLKLLAWRRAYGRLSYAEQ